MENEKKICIHCGTVIRDCKDGVNYFEDDHGHFLCDKCSYENGYTVCDCCGAFTTEGRPVLGGYCVCRNCLDKIYTCREHCGYYLPNGEFTQINPHTCSQCFICPFIFA